MDVGSRLQEDESTLFTWPRYTLALGTKNTAQQPTNLDSGVGRYLEEMHTDYDILEFLITTYPRAPKQCFLQVA